jgi:hypothetical protein
MTHRFVECVPDELEDGVLYVSIPFATVTHRCCCGCGQEVVTPLTPTDWSLTFDGESVSLTPSIGNWSFKCRSHYWIQKGNVILARTCTDREIDAGRSFDALAKDHHYGPSSINVPLVVPQSEAPAKPRNGVFARLFKWIPNRKSDRP